MFSIGSRSGAGKQARSGTQQIADVDPGIAREVLGNGRARDVFDLEIALERARRAGTSGNCSRTRSCRPAPAAAPTVASRPGVVTLHVELLLHALGARMRRRVDEDQVVGRRARAAAPGRRARRGSPPGRTRAPGHASRSGPGCATPSRGRCFDMSTVVDATGAAADRVHRRRAGVGEQVEEALAPRPSRRAVRASGGGRGTGRCRGSR